MNGSPNTTEVPVAPRTPIHKERLELPIDAYRDRVIEAVHQHESAVIIGETGSGKTTRIPEFLLEAFPNSRIAITEPRRIAATSVARFVASQRGEKVGGVVGSQVRGEKREGSDTRALFMTDGIPLAEFKGNPMLLGFDIVMVDEAHERSCNIDFLLGLLKRAQKLRIKNGEPELKIIVASATIEKEKFAKYFEPKETGSSITKSEAQRNFDTTPIVEVPGRLFDVDVKYLEEEIEDEDNIPKVAADQAAQIVNSGTTGDILIFMPGQAEIKATIAALEEKTILNDCEILPLFADMSSEDQDKVFQKNKKRKVIVATNIAETSVTIDGVTVVIDSGLIRQKQYNPYSGIEALPTIEHAQSGCRQRMGRAGRTAPGVCYRLYTKESFEKRPKFQTPEIQRSNLDHVILQMKNLGIDDIENFDFIDPPEKSAIADGIKTLKSLHALDASGNITEIGKRMADLPLAPKYSRMVIEAQSYGCVESIASVTTLLGSKSVFYLPQKDDFVRFQEAKRKHEAFQTSGSDFLTLLAVWRAWEDVGFDAQWAHDNYLNTRTLFEAKEARKQIFGILRESGVSVEDESLDPEAVSRCIVAGLMQDIAILSGRYGRGEFQKIMTRDSAYIFPGSAAFGIEDFVTPMILANVVKTSKPYARMCHPVKPELLFEIAPELFNEESARQPFYDEANDTVYNRKRLVLKDYDRDLGEVLASFDAETTIMMFARLAAEGQVATPYHGHNKRVEEELSALFQRTGGEVSFRLDEWYEKQFAGAKNKRELAVLDQNSLRLDIDTVYSLEKRAEIDRLYPETLSLFGATLPVRYFYSPESRLLDIKKTYSAFITIPNHILPLVSAEDFKIGTPEHSPTLFFNRPDGSSFESIRKIQNAAGIFELEDREIALEKAKKWNDYNTLYDETKKEFGTWGEVYMSGWDRKDGGNFDRIREMLYSAEDFARRGTLDSALRSIQAVKQGLEDRRREREVAIGEIARLQERIDVVCARAEQMSTDLSDVFLRKGVMTNIYTLRNVSRSRDDQNHLLLPNLSETRRLLGELEPLFPATNTLAAQLQALMGSKKDTPVDVAPISKSKEKAEKSALKTPEDPEKAALVIREDANIRLDVLGKTLRTIQAIPKPTGSTPQMKQIRELLEEAAVLKKELDAVRKEIDNTDNISVVRQKPTALQKKVIALTGKPGSPVALVDGFLERYHNALSQVPEIAQKNEVEMTDALQEKIRQAILLRVSGNKKEVDNDEIFEVIVNSLS